MTLLNLSSVLWEADLLESDQTSIPKINFWLGSNLGLVNDYLGTSYTLVNSEASPELTDSVASIFGVIYLDRFYSRQIQSNLGASGFQVLEVREADSVVRLASKTEIAKTFMQLKKDNGLYLKDLVEGWKRFQCVPAKLHSSLTASICGCN